MQSKKIVIGSAQAAEQTPRRVAQPRHEPEGRVSHRNSMSEGPMSETPTPCLQVLCPVNMCLQEERGKERGKKSQSWGLIDK